MQTTAMRFADLGAANSERWATTPQGTFHLTKTELRLLQAVEALDGNTATKATLAEILGRNTKVVGRLLLHLRRKGAIETEPTYLENGAQAGNRWRIAEGAHPGKE